MISLLLITLFVLGSVGGFFSGLLGIGGGIIMVPLLLYIPPLFGLGAMDMKVIAGITMMQSLGGSFSTLIVHRKNRFVHGPLVLLMGGASAIGALIGSVWSKYLSGDLMLGLFAGLALLASGLMFLPHHQNTDESDLTETGFNKGLAILLGLIVGIIGGIIGQGGAFLIIPLMLYALKIPTRIAIGSSVAISFLSALTGLIGKLGTEQVPILFAIVITFGAILGAQIGSRVSKRLHTVTLRSVLAVLIAASALRISYSLFTSFGISVGVIDAGVIIVVAALAFLVGRMNTGLVKVKGERKDYPGSL